VRDVLLSDLTAHLESEFSYPVDLETVVEQSGDLQIEAPNAADTQEVGTILEPLGPTSVDSAEELFDMVYGNLNDDYIGRKYYDDRGSPTEGDAPTDTENVSF
jgi:hypothetical protein